MVSVVPMVHVVRVGHVVYVVHVVPVVQNGVHYLALERHCFKQYVYTDGA